MHMAHALREACADVIATLQAAQEPCVPKAPTAVTHRTIGQESDGSHARTIEHAEDDDIHTWYACSPDKASGLQAASRAMHGMLPARRGGCSPTAGHALDVQRSWLSSELSRQLSWSDAGAGSSPFTMVRPLSGSFSRSAGRESVVAAGWCGRADSFPRTAPLREYRPPTANQPYRSPPMKPTADQPCRRSKAMTPLRLEHLERES